MSPIGIAQRVLMGVAKFVDPFMEEIETITLASPAASVTFSGIDSAFRMFQLTGTYMQTADQSPFIRLNADTGSNYPQQVLDGNNTTLSGGRSTGTSWMVGTTPGVSGNPSTFLLFMAKQAAGSPAMAVQSATGNDTSVFRYQARGLQWNNTTDLISSITIGLTGGNYAANTEITLNGDQSVSI